MIVAEFFKGDTSPLMSSLLLGQFFFPFVFRFLTYLLSCIRFLFALRYFVNYAPLLRAVCKFRYSLLSRLFITSFTGLLV